MIDTIKIEIKSHYGKQHFYPSCELSKQFAKLTETKTLTPEKLKIITSMGLNVELVTPNISFELE
jgi:hypothetical protein